MQKNKRLYKMLCASLFFSSVSTSAVGMLETSEQQNKTFEISQPLSEWPKVSTLSEEEELCYKLTWDKGKRLEENKIELIKNFISTCFDFSFKTKETGIKGIYLGEFDDGENVVFIDKEARTSINHGSGEIMFFNEKDGNNRLEAHPRMGLLHDIKPLDFAEWMKYEFERYIQRIVEDPVGCEILRVSIAKYKAGQRGLPRIKFIPQDDPKMNLAYTPGSYVWKHARRIGRSEFNIYSESCRENRFIMFSPEWFNTDQTGLIMKLRKTKSGAEDFILKKGIVPKDVSLIYQIIYVMHVEGTDTDGTQVIEKRDDQSWFQGNLDGVGPFSISRKRLSILIFKNDKILRTMYGLTKQGLDPFVNESSYMSSRYNCIRPAYAMPKSGIIVNGKRLDKKESTKISKKILKTNRDLYGLFLFKLFEKSFPLDCPKFGRGNYRCSDVDFEKKRDKGRRFFM
ncbi:MAG: hypothetical protein J6T29_02210 [Alphaproteobacteria bacterium]|nr:hypothetical protein [Alphaproteobacteria bacterium]